jgi:fimbrial chaperone protein
MDHRQPVAVTGLPHQNPTYVTLRSARPLYFVRVATAHRWTRLRYYVSIIVGFCSLFLSAEPVRAAASLFIYPTLVLLEVNDRSAEVTIANRGDEIGTFEIGWVDMVMTPDGGLLKQDEKTPWSVEPWVRYSPRRATLPPGESQVIKIAVRRDDTIAEGEYFSHLRVVTINSEDPEAESSPEPAPGVSISARSAIAIPVIWRNSRAASQASIEAVSVDAENAAVQVDVRRKGLLSVRGFLHLLDRADTVTGKALTQPVPLVIYPNIGLRSVAIPLPEDLSVADLPAEATVMFTEDQSLDRGTRVLATRALTPEQ